MKTLKQYIYKTIEINILSDIKATYFVQPEEIIVQAPETYSESDIQIYLDDIWLTNLPSEPKIAKKIFGVNGDSIVDAHFEYDTFEHIDVEPKDYIEWDSKYDIKNSNDDIKLEYFKLKNIKYIIEFDRFDLTDVDDDTAKDALIKIFSASESNNTNKYAVEIQFDEDSLEYRK